MDKIKNTLLLTTIFTAVLISIMIMPAFAQESKNNGIDNSQPSNVATPEVAIAPGTTWYEFSFTAVGVDAAACVFCVPSGGGNSVFVGAKPWTFTCGAGGCAVKVADAFLIGDHFELFDFGLSKGVTSIPGGPGAGDVTDPANTSTDGGWSTAMFVLGAGPHSLTIRPTASPFGGGAAYFRVIDGIVGGESLPIDSTALLIAGASANAVWILPMVVGLAGAGIYITRSKFNWI